MDPGVQLIIWIAGVHFVGFLAVAVLLLPGLHDDPGGQNPGSDSDDGGGRPPRTPPQRPGPPRGGIPLPDAVQASVRVRDRPLALGDLRRAGDRRPTREPSRHPARLSRR
jgi:hypothetical protein